MTASGAERQKRIITQAGIMCAWAMAGAKKKIQANAHCFIFIWIGNDDFKIKYSSFVKTPRQPEIQIRSGAGGKKKQGFVARGERGFTDNESFKRPFRTYTNPLSG